MKVGELYRIRNVNPGAEVWGDEVEFAKEPMRIKNFYTKSFEVCGIHLPTPVNTLYQTTGWKIFLIGAKAVAVPTDYHIITVAKEEDE